MSDFIKFICFIHIYILRSSVGQEPRIENNEPRKDPIIKWPEGSTANPTSQFILRPFLRSFAWRIRIRH